MFYQLSYVIIVLAILWFIFKPLLESITKSKIGYLNKTLQDGETTLKEFDTVFFPKLSAGTLDTVRYVFKKYKVQIFVTNKRVLFRPYSVSMTLRRNLLINPISQGFNIILEGSVKDFLNWENTKELFDANNIYPDFSFEGIEDGESFSILKGKNEKLGMLEVKIFDQKVIQEIKEVVKI
mgnify:CR=1 FL=1